MPNAGGGGGGAGGAGDATTEPRKAEYYNVPSFFFKKAIDNKESENCKGFGRGCACGI